jgi:two-component system nitrogen regulation sensor histidine kinase NtrY
MTTAEMTSAPPFDPSLAESGGGILRKWVAPFAVAIALLSAFLTFMVRQLTPIEPTRHVVYSFLLINAATILLLVGIIVREVWLVIQARRRWPGIGSRTFRSSACSRSSPCCRRCWLRSSPT